MHDDPADAALFAFKQRTEDRLEALELETVRAREEMTGLRGDIARTHRVVMEMQVDTRKLLNKILQRLDQISPDTANGHAGDE